MTPEQETSVRELFERLCDVSGDALDRELDRVEDRIVREAVSRLLKADTRSKGEEPGVSEQLKDEFGEESSDEFRFDQRIGPYRVVRELGRGGLGYVLLAFREDDQFRKRVAVKLVKRGMDTEDIVRRFKQERQVLSALHHPNIVRVTDAGTTSDGRSYFVMEYIEGVPIDQYCNDQGLVTKQRLELFCKVCQAVHYAHQNQIVHRDIKPSNVLVTPDGEPHLLDFGIAKLLNPDLFGSPNTTGPEFRLMTPQFASPEQVEGKPITTASDVYSLGVLLYLILTGHPPYRLTTRIREEVARVVCNIEPERPSTAITKAVQDETTGSPLLTPEQIAKDRDGQISKLRRKLAGDVDNIVLMAMRKKPPRRYASADEFAADIQRHLNGKPVIARPETWWYVTGKLINRNRGAAAVVGMVFCTIVASIITVSYAAAVARTERDRQRKLADLMSNNVRITQLVFGATLTQNTSLVADMWKRASGALAKNRDEAVRIAEEDPDSASKWRAVAIIHGALGQALASSDDPKTAIATFGESAATWKRVRTMTDGTPHDLIFAGQMELVAAVQTKSLKDAGREEMLYLHAIDTLSTARRDLPNDELSGNLLSLAHRNLGFLLLESTAPDAVRNAAEHLKAAVDSRQKGERKLHKVLAALAQAYDKLDTPENALDARLRAREFLDKLQVKDAEDRKIENSINAKLPK